VRYFLARELLGEEEEAATAVGELPGLAVGQEVEGEAAAIDLERLGWDKEGASQDFLNPLGIKKPKGGKPLHLKISTIA
jgi:hypothetical protein